MIDGIGVDIVENKRIKNSINDKWLHTVLTNKEIDILNSKKGRKQIEFICGRFASKEAIIKSISKYEEPHFLEIEILNEKNGSPIAIYKNYKFLISISHEKNYTIAFVILLK